MPSLRVGHTVKLKRDISRMKPDCGKIFRKYIAETGQNCNNKFPTWCAHCVEGFKSAGLGFFLYAKKGDTGRIIETFMPNIPYKHRKVNRIKHAKVIMDDGSGCKTFRLTSLELDHI